MYDSFISCRMWLKTKETNIRLACTNHAHLSLTALPTFPGGPGEGSQQLRKCEAGCTQGFPSLTWGWASSPKSGARMSWLSGLWSQNWAPVVMCGALKWHVFTPHLTWSSVDPPWFCVSLTRNLPPWKGHAPASAFYLLWLRTKPKLPLHDRAITCFEVDALYLFLLLLV